MPQSLLAQKRIEMPPNRSCVLEFAAIDSAVMMGFRSFYVFFFLVILCPQNAPAQDVPKPLEISESSAEYLRAIRLKRVQSDVRYFDPTAAAPNFDTDERPKPVQEQRTRSGSGEVNLPFALVAALFLAAILFLFFKYGGSGSLVLRNDAQNPKRGAAKATAADNKTVYDPQSVDGILRNPDRQQALISLAQLLIYKAVSANDLLLQRSWTARDVLRRMPKNSSYLPELSALVLKGELVHFGERDVSEEEFADYAARAKPLIRELSA